MSYLVVLASLLLILGISMLVDRLVKGNKSVVLKVFSILFIYTFVFFLIYTYGQTIIQSINLDFKSFTNLKATLIGRIVAVALLILFVMFVLFKGIRLVLKFNSQKETNYKLDVAIAIVSIIFDIAAIPNILSFGFAMHFLVALSLVETGLTLKELVLFFFKNNKKELIYA